MCDVYFIYWVNLIPLEAGGMALLKRLSVHNISVLIDTSWATFSIPKQELSCPNSMEKKTGKSGIRIRGDSRTKYRNWSKKTET